MATKTELILVAPAIAGQWLMRRDSNAPLDRERIARLAATITAGASLTEPPPLRRIKIHGRTS